MCPFKIVLFELKILYVNYSTKPNKLSTKDKIGLNKANKLSSIIFTPAKSFIEFLLPVLTNKI